MTQNEPEKPERSEMPAPLDYRSPREERVSEHALGQAVIGAIVTAIGIVGAVFAAFFGVIALGEYDPESPVPLWSLAAALALAALASFIVVSIALFRDPSRRGWAVGMWIGLGLAILVEGICFGSFR